MANFLRIIAKVCCIAVLALLPPTGNAQVPAELRFDNLGIADGLSQSTVNFILQDRQGFMWFCTDDGINRYDGYRFKVFRHERGNPASLQSAHVFCLHEDSSGNLWAIGDNGVSRYLRDSEGFSPVGAVRTLPDGLSYKTVEVGGEVLFLAGGILYRLRTGTAQLHQEPIAVSKEAAILARLPDGNLLLRDGNTLMRYHPDTKAAGPLRCRFPASNINSVVIAGGRAWLIGTEGLVEYDVAAGSVVKSLALPGTTLTCGAFDARGLFWLGSFNGLFCVDTATLQYRHFTSSVNSPFAIAGNDIISMCRDRSGILWIGTNDGGLSKLAYNKFKFGSLSGAAGTASGLAGKAALALEEDGNGNMWLGTEAGNITVYNPLTKALSRCDNSTGCALRCDGYILSLLYADGIMYCGHNNGVDAIDTRRRSVIAAPLVRENAAIKKMFRDTAGCLWAMGGTALYKYDKLRAAFLPVPLPPFKGRLQNVLEDGTDRLWLGLNDGLLRYDPATGTSVDYAQKFPDLIGRGGTMGLCLDLQGRVWVGASETGLLRYEAAADSFVLYGARGLPNSSIYTLLCDASGLFWLSTNAGVSRFDPRTGRFTNFNAADGLLSNEGIGRAAKRDSRGLLWFGNIAGLNIINPSSIPVNITRPLPAITGFKVFDRDVSFRDMLSRHGGIRLKEAENYFTIEYSAMDYTQPAENSYRFMLEGFDRDWRVLSKANSVSYTNLDGGHYRFRLMAYNSDGVASAVPLELPIYIAPHFYRTWWFYTLVLLIIAGSAYAFYRYRITALKKELRLRTNIAADLHDDVGATLSSIKMLTNLLRPKLRAQQDLGDMVDTIHKRAGTTLEAMSDIVWSINPKNDAADNLIMRMKTYTAEVLDDTDIDYRFDTADGLEKVRLSQQKRKEVYLIFKEALSNALKYAEASSITIAVVRKSHRLELTVADNGRGFDAAQLKPTTRGGNGLGNMRQRAAEMGGVFELYSAAGAGTVVTLSVPIP